MPTIDDKLPEDTVVITDISQLSDESQEIFKHYRWTLKDFQSKYNKAMVLGQDLKERGGILVQTKDHEGYEFDSNIERVLGEKAETPESGVTPELARELLAAVAVKYFELLAKQKPVSINGTANKLWGLFQPDHPITSMDRRMLDILAQGYRHKALTPDQPFQYAGRPG